MTLTLDVFTSEARTLLDGRSTFAPVTSTLIAGETDAVLVDAGFIKEDVEALGDFVERSGKRLQTIFITHGHGDHYFGLARLLERFPDAEAVAAPDVVAYIEETLDTERQGLPQMFGDQVVQPTSLPVPLPGGVLELEGHELRVVEIGQGDIKPSTVLHVPSLDAVVAGDIVYNGVHIMTGLGGPAEWDAWLESIDTIERLKPRTLVAGHKVATAPDDDVAAILADTREYLRDFAAAASGATEARDIIGPMLAKHGDRANPTTLYYSASLVVAAARKRSSSVQ